MNTKVDHSIAWITLISGILISGVAEFYSISGLMNIFAAASQAAMVMGIFLGVGKLVATVWIKRYWNIAPWILKTYIIIAIIILMGITSLGTFGFLAKAHSDQTIPLGDVAAKVQLLDDQIKTHTDNVNAAKKALAQMDSTIDEVLSRSTNQQGANSAFYMRRTQAKERATLQDEIAASQAKIAELTETRAPIASQLRSVEAEVGPVKYIAAMLYGGEASNEMLEKAVRLVIIAIVLVFDPLAVVLLLLSQYTFQNIREAEAPTQALINEIATEKLEAELEEIRLEEKSIELEEAIVEAQTREVKSATGSTGFFRSGGLSQFMYAVTPDGTTIELANWRKYDALQIWMERLYFDNGNTGNLNDTAIELLPADLQRLKETMQHDHIIDIDKADKQFEQSMRLYTMAKIDSAIKELGKGNRVYYHSTW